LPRFSRIVAGFLAVAAGILPTLLFVFALVLSRLLLVCDPFLSGCLLFLARLLAGRSPFGGLGESARGGDQQQEDREDRRKPVHFLLLVVS
jgi:hypothetical protein